MFDFFLGFFVALLISHVICNGYANIISMYEEYNENDEKHLEFWMEYYNQQQKDLFG